MLAQLSVFRTLISSTVQAGEKAVTNHTTVHQKKSVDITVTMDELSSALCTDPFNPCVVVGGKAGIEG